MTKSLNGRIALITGASRGIGRAVALAMAGAGAHVVLVARTQGGLEELDDEVQKLGGTATLVPLDITDFPALDRLGASIFERWKKLDILVGNAAILGPLSPVGHIDVEAWDQLLAVNLTANWRLLRSMDMLLRQSDAGRAIFVTSTVARSPRGYWGGYATTKAALECMVRCYADEIANTPVRANLINPGPVATDMRAQAMPGEDPATLATPEDLAPSFVALAQPDLRENGRVFDFREGKFLED